MQNKTRAFCDKNHKKIKENNAIAIKMTKSFKATGVFYVTAAKNEIIKIRNNKKTKLNQQKSLAYN